MKKIFALSAVMLIFINPAKSQLDSIKKIFESYNRNVLNEQVYIHTDREVYSLGDTIYFKAYIREKETLNEIKLSQELNICLLDFSGNNIINEKFLIFDSKSNGQLFVRNNLNEGMYYLVAYTSWMKNFDPSKVYIKKIFISTFTKYEMVPEFSKGFYFPGDTVRLKMKCLDNLSKEVKSVSFNYSVNSKKRSRFKSSTDGDIEFVMDSTLKETPKIMFYGSYREHSLDTAIEIPLITGMDVAFFPEGGHCINGSLSKVAFKSTLSNGVPADIKGAIYNDEGEKLFDVATEHAGMGSFLFMPQKGKRFYFRPEGCYSKCNYELPQGVDNGWKLSITGQSADSVIMYVAKTSHTQEMAIVTVKVRNSIVYYYAFPIGMYKALAIRTDSLPAGVATITLFDENMLPQAERLVFINFPKLNTTELIANSPSYQPRDSVMLSLKIKDKSKLQKSNFSLTVYDEDLGSTNKIDEPGIIASSYLSPEIKGNIYNPNYYFSSDSAIILQHLDLLLLTQGWRNYNYLADVNTMKKPVNQETIKGQLKRFKFGVGLVPTKGKVNLFYNLNGSQIETDEKGNFSFTPIYEKGFNPNIFLSASNQKGKIDVSLVIDSGTFENNLTTFLKTHIDSMKEVSSYNVQEQKAEVPEDKLLNKDDLIWIEEIVVSSKRSVKELGLIPDVLKGIESDRKIKKEVIASYGTMEALMNYFLLRYNDTDDVYYCDDRSLALADDQNNPLRQVVFFVDDVNYGPKFNNVASMNPSNIESIHFWKSLTSIYIFGGPVLLINTKKEYYKKTKFLNNTYNTRRFSFTKEFYSPVYDTEKKRKAEIPDYRRTIFWEPNVKFDQNGEARIKFYNADRYTKIKCIAEGFAGTNTPVNVETSYSITPK